MPYGNCDDLGCMSRSFIDCKLFYTDKCVERSLRLSRASCLNWTKLAQDLRDRFSQFFHQSQGMNAWMSFGPVFLACSANLPTGLYILLALIFFFFLTWDKLSQDPLDRFSRSVHKMKGICVNFLDPDLFFDSFRDVAMATDLGQNLQSDLHSAPWHFKKELNIAIRISRWIAQMIPLHRVQIWWTLVQ